MTSTQNTIIGVAGIFVIGCITAAYLITASMPDHDSRMLQMSLSDQKIARSQFLRECVKKNPVKVCGGME